MTNNYPIPVTKNLARPMFRQVEADMRKALIPYAVAEANLTGHYPGREFFCLWRAEKHEGELLEFGDNYEKARARLPQPKIWKYQWKPGSKKKCFSEGLI